MSDPYATQPMFKYAHFAGAVSTTQLKTGPGILHTVTINQVGATPSGIALADSATGGITPLIASQLSGANTTIPPMTVTYDVGFSNGLTFTMATAANTMDVTVSYI